MHAVMYLSKSIDYVIQRVNSKWGTLVNHNVSKIKIYKHQHTNYNKCIILIKTVKGGVTEKERQGEI